MNTIHAVHTTPPTSTGYARYQLRRWWKLNRSRSRATPRVGIYNDGRHLFIENKRTPGTFLRGPGIASWTNDPLTFLVWFKHGLGIAKINDLTIIHHGHLNGINGGPADVSIFGNLGTILRVKIEPLWIAYVIELDNYSLASSTVLMPLPLAILPLR